MLFSDFFADFSSSPCRARFAASKNKASASEHTTARECEPPAKRLNLFRTLCVRGPASAGLGKLTALDTFLYRVTRTAKIIGKHRGLLSLPRDAHGRIPEAEIPVYRVTRTAKLF